MLWSRGTARAALIGPERTHNPSPAAAALLGKRKIARAQALLKRKGIKRRHRGNPLPGIVSLAGSLIGGKLAKRLRSPAAISAADNAAVDQLVPLAIAGSEEARAEILRRSLQSAKQNRRDYAKMRLLEVDTALATAAKAEGKAVTRERGAAGERREARIAGVATSIGSAATQALLGRGRGLSRRRRSTRSRGRSFGRY